MNRRRRTIVPAILLAALTIAAGGIGCASTPAEKQDGSETEQLRTARLDREAIALGEQLLKKFAANDAKGFLSLLSSDARKKFGLQEFQSTRETLKETLGEVTAHTYLTKLEAPVFQAYLWKVEFRRKAIRNPEKEYRQETVFRIVTGDLNGKPYIVSFGFL